MKTPSVNQAAVLAALAALLTAGSTSGAQDVKVKEEKPGLFKKAKITPDSATASAKAAVPKGVIQSAELEEEDGKLIYTFDLKTAGKSGADEVHVDAMTGKVSVAHETPAQEKAEAAKAGAAPKKPTAAAKTPPPPAKPP